MFLIMITHAEARREEPRHIYRGLTEKGREQVKVAAAEFRKVLPTILPKLDDNTLAIGKIMSSQMARCLETVLLFSDEIRPLTKTSEISISESLRDIPNQPLKSDYLVAAMKGLRDEVILIGAHSDLIGALPPTTRLINGANDNGNFKPFPVLVVVDYDPNKTWEGARALYCQGYLDSAWKDLLAH